MTDTKQPNPPPPVRVFQGKRPGFGIPEDILQDESLNHDISTLPSHYRLEVHKCVWQIRKNQARIVALQLPEGLTMLACMLAAIFERHAEPCKRVIIMADVTYGACCVDDYTAQLLGVQLLIHYGHSCLIPITQTLIPCVYVFVEIGIDVEHVMAILQHNYGHPTLLIGDRQTDTTLTIAKKRTEMALVSTIQFISAVHAIKARQSELLPLIDLIVPQSKPLSPGEILGCTAPRLPPSVTHCLYIGDGRFHLEAMMIANPQVQNFLRYDPYTRKMTREEYDHEAMQAIRMDSIRRAANTTTFGIILGTLGRQGSVAVLDRCKEALQKAGKLIGVVLMMSEIRPETLQPYAPFIEAWVQVACPRLSIDWGRYFGERPLLTPYELNVALSVVPAWHEKDASEGNANAAYPMDYYARETVGPWTPYTAAPTDKK